MKILIISPHKSFGGASASNHNIASMLSANGHTVVYSDDISECNDSPFPFYSYRWKMGFKAFRYLKESQFDYIIFGQAHYAIYYIVTLLTLRWSKGVKFGLIFHSLCLENTWKDKMYERAMSLSSFFANDLFFVSNYTKEAWNQYWLVRLNKMRQHVIYNAVSNHAARSHPMNSLKPKISFVGRVSEEKGPNLFCEAARFFKDDFCFQVFGDGPLLEKLKLEYSNDVKWFGYCDSPGQIYTQTDILMVTSYFENCPMSILEAMTFGVPVISTKVGGIPEIVKSGVNGEFFDSRDLENSFSESINKILNSYGLYQDNCIRESEKFLVDNVVRKWGDIFNQ